MPTTFDYKFTSDILFSELYLTEAGWEICQSGHTFGPAVREYFLLHYITSGKGYFNKNGKTYHLTAGTCFVIFPSEITTYTADEEDPWTYYWVGFSGSLATKLLTNLSITPAKPIHRISLPFDEVAECIKEIHVALTIQSSGDLKGLGLFLLFLSMMSSSSNHPADWRVSHKLQEDYLSKSIHFVQEHFSGDLTITMIAKHVGIERSYLFRIFQALLHMSPQEYILSFRIHKAAQLLIETNISISNISALAGFHSPTAFGVAFKKLHHISPRTFRKLHGGILNLP